MSVYRARSSCPLCSHEEEIWFLQGKVEPIDLVECTRCSNHYEPHQFVSSFLDLYQNSTITSNYVSMTSTL